MELFDVLDVLELLEFEELDEFDELLLPEPLELLAGAGALFAPDVPALLVLEVLDVLLPDELLVTDACVEPGSTAITMPAATTEAADTVTVVALRRRLPCSRSATARAIWRAAAWFEFRRARARSRSLPAVSSQEFISLSLTSSAVSTLGE